MQIQQTLQKLLIAIFKPATSSVLFLLGVGARQSEKAATGKERHEREHAVGRARTGMASEKASPTLASEEIGMAS
jgi:hypothetical protein